MWKRQRAGRAPQRTSQGIRQGSGAEEEQQRLEVIARNNKASSKGRPGTKGRKWIYDGEKFQTGKLQKAYYDSI